MLLFDINSLNAQGILSQEVPTPNACKVTSLVAGVPNSFITLTTFALQSAMSRGGEIGAAKGLSLARGALSVTITTSGMSCLKAARTSFISVGVPIICGQHSLTSGHALGSTHLLQYRPCILPLLLGFGLKQ